MRLRVKLRFGIALAVVIALIAAAILAATFAGELSSIRRVRDMDAIVKSVFELQLLASECRLTALERARMQWQAKYESILADLHAVVPTTQEQRIILGRMLENHASLGRTFATLYGGERDEATTLDNAREGMRRRLIAKMDVSLLAMLSDANQLFDSLYDHMIAGHRKADTAVALSSLAMVVLIVGLVVMVNRSAIRPLQKLEEDSAVIGRGDLSHRTLIRTNDEVGQLSRAFDTMVERLRSVMAHRDELDREVSRRKRAQEGLRSALGELKRSNDDLEQFAYATSHDLQEPLRKVAAFGSLLIKECGDGLPDSGRQYIEIMQHATERMQRLISDLLTFSRVSTRGQAFVPVDLNEIAEGVLSDLETRIGETGAAVDVAELPTIQADPIQMRQLVQNLLVNAIKFHKEGETPCVKVYVDEAPEDDAAPSPPSPFCHIVVEDNGIGFDTQHAERIFGVFQRLHLRHEFSGSGIGLAVCRRIAERHGGSVTAEGSPGGGAKFRVSLPIRHEERRDEA